MEGYKTARAVPARMQINAHGTVRNRLHHADANDFALGAVDEVNRPEWEDGEREPDGEGAEVRGGVRVG